MREEALIMDLQIDGLIETWPTRDEAESITRELIKLINMTPVGGFAFRDTPIGPSFWQMLMESHFCADCMDSEVWVTLSSCKPYNHKMAKNFIVKKFGIKNYKSRVILRGVGIMALQKRSRLTRLALWVWDRRIEIINAVKAVVSVFKKKKG